MEIVIYNGWRSDKPIILNFDSKVAVNVGKFKSLSELVTLKNIQKELSEYFGLRDHWKTRYALGLTKTEIYVDEEDYERIKTIVKRDNIIENILSNDK